VARLFTLPAGRRAKFVVAALFILICGAAASQSSKFESAQKNETSSWLPGNAESLKALAAVKRYPGGELAPAVIVYERRAGLTAADKARIAGTVRRLNTDRPALVLPAQRPIFAHGGRAAIVVQPVKPGTGQGNAFRDAAQWIRDRAGDPQGGLDVKLTGAAGYSLDAIKVFGNINGTLLLVAAVIVLVLLIAIYRSPIFWIIPFFTVLLAEAAARGFGYELAQAGVTINGQSGGILPVLVFGAGTDYALLLVSRYREELRRHEDKHDAMRVALSTAGPAILASGLTVIAALLTLSVAQLNSTAGLGPVGAMGVAVAMIAMLTMLPAALTICGRGWFWPRVPHVGEVGLRALLAPLLLVLSVILSFAAALGTGIFVSTHIFGFPGVDPSLPLLCFVFLVALGIDYNIFLMARVREEAQRHGTRQGTLRGLAVTGSVITGAGIVLAGTFGALAVLPLIVLTEIGFIVAFGVLLDTFIVRSVIVPALVMDVGRRVWWPSRMARAERRVHV
jgi:uncharacterized membrane protein YdfJ with MMPL/SSD domain